MGLVMRWMLDEIGGLEAMYARNREKAAMLYDVLDASDGFTSAMPNPIAAR